MTSIHVVIPRAAGIMPQYSLCSLVCTAEPFSGTSLLVRCKVCCQLSSAPRLLCGLLCLTHRPLCMVILHHFVQLLPLSVPLDSHSVWFEPAQLSVLSDWAFGHQQCVAMVGWHVTNDSSCVGQRSLLYFQKLPVTPPARSIVALMHLCSCLCGPDLHAPHAMLAGSAATAG